jgi:hypothetical protein
LLLVQVLVVEADIKEQQVAVVRVQFLLLLATARLQLLQALSQ